MRKIVSIVIVLLMGAIGAFVVQAQTPTLETPVATVFDRGVLVEMPRGQIMFDLAGQVSHLTWSDDGSKLAMLVFDEELDLYVADLETGYTKLNTGALEVFPPTFTSDGHILYVEQGENRVIDPEIDYKVSLMKIAPEADAQPEKLGEFSMLLECDGGSSTPMDWQYWGEAGAFGSAMMLKQTRIGILHSTSCGDTGFALFDPNTGVDRVLSVDQQKIAAVRLTFNPPEHIRSLVLIDLATGGVTEVETEFQPDQVAWGMDTALYYSTREKTGDLLQSLTLEDQATVKKQAFNQEPDALIELPTYSVKIQQVDPAGQTSEKTVYESTAFAIGRMAAIPEGLLFSEIPNGERWIQGLLDGSITAPNLSAAREAVPISIHLLDLDSLTADVWSEQGLEGFVVRGCVLSVVC